MLNTIRAEAQYHARVGGEPTDNPYPKETEYHDAWNEGFIGGLLIVRRHYQDNLKVYIQLTKDHRKLEQEYESFVTEMGY